MKDTWFHGSDCVAARLMIGLRPRTNDIEPRA
jgi:hypothetical protein